MEELVWMGNTYFLFMDRSSMGKVFFLDMLSGLISEFSVCVEYIEVVYF